MPTTTKEITLHEMLVDIQKELKVSKNQYNSFGKYRYRSCEDILEGVKPLLAQRGLTILLADEIIQVGERYYVKATATITTGDKSIAVSAYAREEDTKKGMDESQVTGAASSYARKYALNGLLAIDDSKDSDTTSKADQPAVKVDQKVIDEIEATTNVADLTATCKRLTTGKSAAYKKAVFAHYNAKKEKLGGEI